MVSWVNFLFFPFLARFLLVILFPFSGMDKIIHWKDALDQARSTPGVPGVKIALVCAIAVEIVAPVCIIFHWHDHLASFVLAGFCVVTAVLYHQFWRFSDFWTPGVSIARQHFWDFLKNFGLVGGLILLLITASFAPVSTILTHPLASAPASAQPSQ